MKPELKTKWIDELRSGKHAQCRQVLARGDERCALGVLVHEVLGQARPHDWRDRLERLYDLRDEQIFVIGDMNDSGQSFAEIADYIEANL